MSAAELSIDAASQADITRASFLKAIAQLARDGGKMTQQAIADLAEVSQGWVSKFFAGMDMALVLPLLAILWQALKLTVLLHSGHADICSLHES